MAEHTDIHEFATTYYEFYTQARPPKNRLLKTFGEDCRKLGFKSDLGESFMRLYPADAFYEASEFAAIADRIEDPYLLGTAIYSRWRLVTQWEPMNLLTDEKRSWFREALGRLSELTAEPGRDRSGVRGRINTVHIVSNNLQGVPGSAMATGVEQRISLSASGELQFSETKYNADPGGHNVISRHPPMEIDPEEAKTILDGVMAAFPFLSADETTKSARAAAPGTWTLTATNQWGRPYRATGELGARIIVDGTDLSDRIRAAADDSGLLLFDGNPDLVMRVEVQYQRGIPGGQGEADSGIEWIYDEELVFDRETESMEHYLDAGPDHRSRTTSHVAGAVSDFLDAFDPDRAFSDPPGNPPEAVAPMTEIAAYQLTVTTRYGNNRVFRGTYDARSVPPEWSAFIDRTLSFMGFFGYGELFDEARYGRALRLTTDKVYALVVVEGSDEPEWYLSDDVEIKDGDYVTVKGPEGKEIEGRIQQIIYGSRAEAPVPYDSMSHLLSTPGIRASVKR